jgi:hypothetical protein
LEAAWAEAAAGDLPLAHWRLHAVEAALHERKGNEAAAGRARRARAEAIETLIQTLPDGHNCRDALRAASPVLSPLE